MSKIDLNQVLKAAVAAGVVAAASAPNNDLQQKDAPVVTAVVTEQLKPVIEDAQARIDHASNQEPFYLSRQWWVTVLSLLSAMLGLAGYAFPAEMQQQALAIIMAAVGLISTVTLFYNRYFARKPIGK